MKGRGAHCNHPHYLRNTEEEKKMERGGESQKRKKGGGQTGGVRKRTCFTPYLSSHKRKKGVAGTRKREG